MKKTKNWLVLALALAFPLLYHQFNGLFYKAVLSDTVIDLMSTDVRNYIQANNFLLDAIFCVLMIALSTPIYLAM